MGQFHNEHEPLGGRLLSKTTLICAILAAPCWPSSATAA